MIEMARIIQTTDKELFDKFRSLRFTDEIVINKSKKRKVSKIINNINKSGSSIQTRNIGPDHFIVRRMRPLNINIKLRKR